MSDKIKLLEVANKKVSADKEFIAYILSNYIQIEHTTDKEIMAILGCDTESYYKLGLCKFPNITDDNYLDRLNNICTYIGISSLELNKIIKRVSSVLRMRDAATGESSLLMAARDKKKKDK